jgi:hypothetical protein
LANICVPENAYRHTVFDLLRRKRLGGLIVQKDRCPLADSAYLPESGVQSRLCGWPYSDPRGAGVSGVNTGESRGPCRDHAGQNQQVRGSVVLARKGWNGTLTQ